MERGKGALGNITVREGQSLLEADEIQKMRQEGEDLLADLSQDEATQAFMARSQEVLGRLWEQAMVDLGMEGDVSSFLEQGSEIWSKVDTEALGQVMSTVLKGCLELVLEYIPNLEMPDIYGSYESPLGEICYSIGNLKFASFDFDAQNGVQIRLGNPLSLHLDEIGATVDDFVWQYAKPGSMIGDVLGEGAATLAVQEASVHMEYGYCYEQGRVTLTILQHRLELKELSVTVGGASQSWLYNMMLQILNTRLRQMLERQLLDLAISKLTELSKMLNELSQGFLNIELHRDIAQSLREAEADHRDADRTVQILTECFRERYREPFPVTLGTEGRFLSILPALPKAMVLLPADQSSAKAIDVVKLAQEFAGLVCFGVVKSKEEQVWARHGVGGSEGAMLLFARDRQACLQYPGELSTSLVREWLHGFVHRAGDVSPVTPSSCSFVFSHLPRAMAVVVALGEAPGYFPQLAQATPDFTNDLCFAHCAGREDAGVLCGQLGADMLAGAEGIVVVPSAKGTERAKAVVYEGEMSQLALQAFLSRFIVETHDVARLTTNNIDTFFHKELLRPKLLLFSSHLGTPALYRKLFKKYGKAVSFGIVNQDKELQEMFNVSKIPFLTSFVRTGAKPAVFQSKLVEEEVVSFVRALAEPPQQGGYI